MNRREFLSHLGKRALVAGFGSSLSNGTSQSFNWLNIEDGDTVYGPRTKPITIEDIVNGGSESRRELMSKLEDGPTLMRHVTNLRATYIRAHTEWVNQQREASPKDWFPEYNILDGDIGEINLTIERLENMGLLDFLKGTTIKTSVDPDFFLAKISTESVGIPDAESDMKALGISQILPDSYEEMRGHTNAMIRNIRNTFPKETLDYLVDKPLRDLLLLNSTMLESMGVPLDYDSIHIKDLEKYVNIWVPYGIIALREYGEFPGTEYGNNLRGALINPRIGLEAGALIALNFWLTTFSPTKNPNIAMANYDPGQALARPSFPLAPQAPASSYIRGQNGVHGDMRRIMNSTTEEYDILEGMRVFEEQNTFTGKLYSSKLLRMTEYLKSN